ncbi:Os04g0408900, partial [Oryza sativa Japonica Group]
FFQLPKSQLYFQSLGWFLIVYFFVLQNNMIIEEVNKGLNPGTIVLLVVATLLILFFVGNYALYMYAQKTLPPRKKKPVSKKKLKREKLKQGVSAPGE